MLVYGDLELALEPRAWLDRAADRVSALPPGGVERHAELCALLVDAGAIAQALLDQQSEALGGDEDTLASVRLHAFCRALGRAVARSWHSHFRELVLPAPQAWRRLGELLPEAPLVTRVPKGYAFYAVYPECFLEASRELGSAPGLVVGVRSIGTSLGAVVAASFPSARFVTLRPAGDPFARTVRLGPRLARCIARAVPPGVAVVHEGPGLSGSSFNAVADALEAQGAPAQGLTFFPSHAGHLGPRSSAPSRARWDASRRILRSFDALMLDSDPRGRGLTAWSAPLTGPPLEPLQDIGAGHWRARVFASEAAWPPSIVSQERRKYLLRSERGLFLLKFSGLGAMGQRALKIARFLEDAGIGPPTLGLAHGFLVQRWLSEARPLTALRSPPPRSDLVTTLRDYLRLRTRLPATNSGASPLALWEMARRNIELGVGPDAAEEVRAWHAAAERAERDAEPVCNDGKLDLWEWLAAPSGRIVKADGIDHSAGHDLVGCQDIAWDVAAASVEWELQTHELDPVALAVGRPLARVMMYRLFYLAFRMGQCLLGADMLAAGAEEQRLRAAAKGYRDLVTQALSARPHHPA